MTNILFISLALAMLATLAVLVIGIAAMIRGGAFNQKYGNKLMRWRLVLQGVALALFALAVMSTHS